MQIWSKKVRNRFFGGLLAAYLVLFFAFWQLPDSRFQIYFLNIGQGDSIFVKTPEGHQILIDGGPQNKVLEELSEVMPFFDKSIDLMVLTHPHADHVDGLVEVLKRYEVANVLFTGVDYKSPGYKEFLRILGEKKVRVFVADSKTDFVLGEVMVDVLYPPRKLIGKKFSNINNSSIALKITYKDQRVLLTGDLEIEGEKELLALGYDLRAEIFKAGHHGSRTASSWPLLEKVRPEVVVIQSGEGNSYEHPHRESLENFERVGVRKVLRNDREGRVEIVF